MGVQLSGAVAVITGAGSGIGRATALELAARGARIVVTDVRDDRAATVADEIGPAALPARCDVTSTADLEAVRDLALDRFGRVDVVMNNAGVVVSGPVEAIPLDAWERIIDVNLLGVVRGIQVFLPVDVVAEASQVGRRPRARCAPGTGRPPRTATSWRPTRSTAEPTALPSPPMRPSTDPAT
jgi:NAD(P)-dependent dehydrogenase (short-subunit alcohol dehydrogenase family)